MRELEKEFIGIGEVKGLKFKQLRACDKGYLYSVNNDSDRDEEWYEVFRRKELTPRDNGFVKNLEPYVKYPKAEQFGEWAWTYSDQQLIGGDSWKAALEKYAWMQETHGIRVANCGL